jgi:hypothetical protein
MQESISNQGTAKRREASRVDALAALACFHGTPGFSAQYRIILEYVDPETGQTRKANIGVKELPAFFPGVRIFKKVPQRNCGVVSDAGYALLRELAQTHQCPEIRFRLHLDPADPPLLNAAARLHPGWGIVRTAPA